MGRVGCGVIMLGLLAQRAAAEPPVELTAEAHVRTIGNVFADDDALDGRGPGASVRVGRQWLHLQLSWDYVSESVADPFDPVRYDEHAHQLQIGPAFVAHLGSRVSASAGIGLALAYYNGRSEPELRTGAWTDVRLDVDLVRIAPHQSLAVVLDGTLVIATPGGVAWSIGLGYHLR